MTQRKDLQDRIAGKGFNLLSHYNLVHKFILLLQINEHAGCKSRCGQRVGEASWVASMANDDCHKRKRDHPRGTEKGKDSSFCNADGHVPPRNSELDQKFQKDIGLVVLRSDIVKDNSGSYAVITEQGWSASQMTAAKIMDIISRLPGCDGQAADAVSAYTQVKLEDAPKLLKIPKSECPDIWIRLPRHKWPKSWSSMEDPVVPLERNV